MPNPLRSEIHVDTPLSEIAIAYTEQNHIADLIFPKVTVQKQSDKYFIWTKGFWLRNNVEKRTPGDTYPEGRLKVSNTSYFCDIYHLAFPIADEDRQNEDPAIQLEITGTKWLAGQFSLNRELSLATGIFSTSAWENYVTGVTDFPQWSDYDNSDPVGDINTGIETIEKSTGVTPNTLVIGREVFNILKEHPNLVDKFKYTGVGILNESQVGQALGVEKLLIGKGVYESTREGDATPTRGYIWGKNALLLYVPPAPGLRVPAAGYTFVWNIDGGGLTVQIKNVRQDWRDRDLLQAKHAFDDKITGTDLGYYLTAAVA